MCVDVTSLHTGAQQSYIHAVGTAQLAQGGLYAELFSLQAQGYLGE